MILVGINVSILQIKTVENGDFCVMIHVRSKPDGFEWILVTVYGAAQDRRKPEFLSELVRLCNTETLFTYYVNLRKKVLIISILDGPSCLMQLLKVLIFGKSSYLVASIHGLIGELFRHMKS
jgi:hypothetical protein